MSINVNPTSTLCQIDNRQDMAALESDNQVQPTIYCDSKNPSKTTIIVFSMRY
jgi:hypothetical protein